MTNLRPPRALSVRSHVSTVSRHAPSFYSLGTGTTNAATSFVSEQEAEYYISTSKRRRRFDKFRWWIYNPETREVMNRSGKSWLQISAFFCVFYGLLAAFFVACFSIFMYTCVMLDYPYLTGMQSTLKLSPGLGLIPQPDYWTSLIAFRTRKYSFARYVDDIIAFTQWYENYGQAAARTGSKLVSTDTNDNGFAKCPRPAVEAVTDTRRSCRQNLNFGGRCNIRRRYGYYWGMPCVILKLNRIYGWLPDPIANHTGVIVKCYGRNAHDAENLGKICYHDDNDPEGNNLCKNDYGEFKSYYFPYLKQLNYQSPLIMLEFLAPMRNTIIMIECRAYAKNINYDPYTGEGLVRFELLVE